MYKSASSLGVPKYVEGENFLAGIFHILYSFPFLSFINILSCSLKYHKIANAGIFVENLVGTFIGILVILFISFKLISNFSKLIIANFLV